MSRKPAPPRTAPPATSGPRRKSGCSRWCDSRPSSEPRASSTSIAGRMMFVLGVTAWAPPSSSSFMFAPAAASTPCRLASTWQGSGTELDLAERKAKLAIPVEAARRHNLGDAALHVRARRKDQVMVGGEQRLRYQGANRRAYVLG